MANVCRSCNAPVLWATVAKSGKRAILDALPVANGNYVFIPGSPGMVRVLSAGEETEGDRYLSHFATCPDRADWRSRG